MAAAVDEPTAEELTELAQLAVALTGDPQRAAELVGVTLAMARRRPRRRSADRETAHRDLMVQQFVSPRPAAAGPLPAEGLPAEFREVASRLAELPPLARAILVLVRLKGLTLAEVAGILDRTPAKVQRELEAAGTTVQADPYVVRAVLETLSWRAPDENAIRRAQVSAERRLVRRRHRIRLLVAGVVVLVLAGVGVPTVWALRPLPARAAGDWSYGLAFLPSANWQVEAHFLTVDEEVLAISGPDTNCEIQALQPAAAATRGDLGTTGERAWVRGRPVRIIAFRQGFRIIWPYAGSGVVTMTCDGSGADRSSVLALANRLQFRPGQRMPVPVAFGVLPDGLRPAYAGRQEEQTFVGLITGPDLESAEIIVFAGLFGEDFDIAEWTAREVVQVNGVPAQIYVDDELVALCLPAAAPDPLCVGSDIDDEDDDEAGKEARIAANLRRVRAVTEGMRIAPDLEDPSTWFDAREALPG
jgi:DNA-directed RNA polymerase specialized sigma24 family protein